MDDYVVVNGRRFRKGYTTGSCAAAASKAAVLMLFSAVAVNRIDIDTPAGVRLTLPVSDAAVLPDRASCSVVKDGGDDPDTTSGLKIFAEAVKRDSPGIDVQTGEGIGMVTLPGLKVEVGKPAINPAPMEMILKEVAEVLPESAGVTITLSIPGGVEAALKTYNPKLGIVGGISIIGTSGIVNPMSEEAWKEALAVELHVLVAKGAKSAVYVFGNYGEDFIEKKLGLDKGNMIKISNFIGYMLDKAVEYGLEKILIVGHTGKLIKVSAGIFHTHSRVADGRLETLAAYAALEGADTQTVTRIYGCRTTEAALEIIKENQLPGVFNRIVSNVSKRCMDYAFGKLKVGSVLFHEDQTLLAMDDNAVSLVREAGGKYEQQ